MKILVVDVGGTKDFHTGLPDSNSDTRPQVALLLILLLHIGRCRISCFQPEIDHGVALSASDDAIARVRTCRVSLRCQTSRPDMSEPPT